MTRRAPGDDARFTFIQHHLDRFPITTNDVVLAEAARTAGVYRADQKTEMILISLQNAYGRMLQHRKHITPRSPRADT